jgi:hypothetical protein
MILLIACSEQKSAFSGPASKVYTGVLFQLGLRYATVHGYDAWLLSAKYGFIRPDTIIEPYDDVFPRHKPYSGPWPDGIGFYVGGQSYFGKAPARIQPLVPYYKNRGLNSWKSHISNMLSGIGCPHGFTSDTRVPCPRCSA